jgi:hypothetical protein
MRDRLGGGRVIDEHIELAVGVERRLNEALAILVFRDVALTAMACAPAALQASATLSPPALLEA